MKLKVFIANLETNHCHIPFVGGNEFNFQQRFVAGSQALYVESVQPALDHHHANKFYSGLMNLTSNLSLKS